VATGTFAANYQVALKALAALSDRYFALLAIIKASRLNR